MENFLTTFPVKFGYVHYLKNNRDQRSQRKYFNSLSSLILRSFYKSGRKEMKKEIFVIFALSILTIVVTPKASDGQDIISRDSIDLRQNASKFTAWSKPVNLGPSINSTRNFGRRRSAEKIPLIHPKARLATKMATPRTPWFSFSQAATATYDCMRVSSI